MKRGNSTKKWVRLIAICVICMFAVVSFTACGTPAASTEKDAAKTETSKAETGNKDAKADEGKKIKIGFSQCTMNHPWRVAMVEGNKKYAAENLKDVELIVTDGQNNATKQASDIDDLIAQKVDVLIVSPLQSDALTPAVKKAMDAGIKVVTVDRKVETPVTLHIGGGNIVIGTLNASYLNTKLNGKGNIIEIQGTAGASATIDRDKGFRDELAKYPGLKIVATQYCDYLREPAMKFMEDALQRFGPGEIQAVYAHNDEMALGAIKAIEAAGRSKEIVVVSADGQNEGIEAIKAGKMLQTVTYPFCAPEAVQYAYKLAKGENLDKEIVLPNKPINVENVDEWIGKGF